MRQNNNARRPRRNNNRHNGNGRRNVNPKVQTFDSNGPSVRVRGNAFQISDKYTSLARDAASSGDHVLAESYLQHAEHYQRFINEYNERMEKQKAAKDENANKNNPNQKNNKKDAKNDEKLEDLDQGFLVGDKAEAEEKQKVELEVVAEEKADEKAEATETPKKKPATRRKPVAKKAKSAE